MHFLFALPLTIHLSSAFQPVIMGSGAQILRDMRKRVSASDLEVSRRAYLYVARNVTLPATLRHRAQLGLNALNGGEGRMVAVKNRCATTGKGRGKMPVKQR